MVRTVATQLKMVTTLLCAATASGQDISDIMEPQRTKQHHQASRTHKTLYGLDDRLEEADVTDASMRRNGAATVALVESADLRFDATTNAYRNRYQGYTLDYARGGLCAGERYGSQASLAYCSGTLIAPDLVATAGHCLAGDTYADLCRRGSCDRLGYLVFDFTSDSNNVFPASNVYTCAEVVHCVQDDTNCGDNGVTVDWAVIRLDRYLATSLFS